MTSYLLATVFAAFFACFLLLITWVIWVVGSNRISNKPLKCRLGLHVWKRKLISPGMTFNKTRGVTSVERSIVVCRFCNKEK